MRGLNGWLRKLEGNQAAVLATLLKELERLTSSEESSGMEVGEVILKDANLTSNIIRVGNSVMYNSSNIPVTTVSRAILNIGFDQLRSICISIKVLESVLQDNPSDLLISRLATTLHGAAQAKALSKRSAIFNSGGSLRSGIALPADRTVDSGVFGRRC